ncbi:hypothetical protein L596_011312 [Steinernema carpocapsae]|uniref:Uncharacterized protein n=1 Tax=Steinernema carpocapsae TaxID=34508 RepID=A0A4U5NUD6_STECR|nr:hypothetical protein L596_011312 [Steinernema carpocapsae]
MKRSVLFAFVLVAAVFAFPSVEKAPKNLTNDDNLTASGVLSVFSDFASNLTATSTGRKDGSLEEHLLKTVELITAPITKFYNDVATFIMEDTPIGKVTSTSSTKQRNRTDPKTASGTDSAVLRSPGWSPLPWLSCFAVCCRASASACACVHAVSSPSHFESSTVSASKWKIKTDFLTNLFLGPDVCHCRFWVIFDFLDQPKGIESVIISCSRKQKEDEDVAGYRNPRQLVVPVATATHANWLCLSLFGEKRSR